jgi:hypothetical protein
MSRGRRPEPNPILAALATRGADARAVAIGGYVGQSESGTLRLHPATDPSMYVDVPDDAIIEFDDSQEPGRAVVYVSATSDLTFVVRGDQKIVKARDVVAEPMIPVRTLARLRRPIGGLGVGIGGGIFVEDSCDLKCALEYLDCLDSGESQAYCETRQFFCRLFCGSTTV